MNTISPTLEYRLSEAKEWRRRYEREGRASLTSQMSRPASGILGQFAAEVKKCHPERSEGNAILEMRRANAGWRRRPSVSVGFHLVEPANCFAGE